MNKYNVLGDLNIYKSLGKIRSYCEHEENKLDNYNHLVNQLKKKLYKVQHHQQSKDVEHKSDCSSSNAGGEAEVPRSVDNGCLVVSIYGMSILVGSFHAEISFSLALTCKLAKHLIKTGHRSKNNRELINDVFQWIPRHGHIIGRPVKIYIPRQTGNRVDDLPRMIADRDGWCAYVCKREREREGQRERVKESIMLARILMMMMMMGSSNLRSNNKHHSIKHHSIIHHSITHV